MFAVKIAAALDQLIAGFARLPGIGRRSAERMALHLVVKRDGLIGELIGALQAVERNVVCCSRCGALTTTAADPCRFCTDQARDGTVLCVVEDPAALLTIENAGGYRGRYHALMGRLSPMRGESAASLRIQELIRRLDTEPVAEIILALDADVESDATASYIRDLLAGRKLKITRLALGLSVGSGLAYSDALTIARAIKGRQQFANET